MDPSITQEIVERLHELPASQQQLVLDVVRSMASHKPQGVPTQDLLPLTGAITAEDARQMMNAIEEGCERVDANAW
jgi:hypothetical protein